MISGMEFRSGDVVQFFLVWSRIEIFRIYLLERKIGGKKGEKKGNGGMGNDGVIYRNFHRF